MKINVDNLKDKIQGVAESLGFELAELSAPVVGGRLILRVFIHSPNGITIDDCATVSRNLSDLFDTEDLISSRYTLEVSSLGLDRPLLTLRDFARRIGERVKVNYKVSGRENTIEGVLTYSDNADIKIDIGDNIVAIPVDANPRGKIVI
jgi:ribosome maturation factor RimP